MTNLGRIIREIQRDAAALSTDALRTEIGVSLDVLDAVVGRLQNFRHGPENVQEWALAVRDVIDAVLVTALYTRELTRRPAEHLIARVHLSLN